MEGERGAKAIKERRTGSRNIGIKKLLSAHE
jgi:hypothetical protein